MFSFNLDRFLPDTFQATYKCYSVSMLPDERQNLEKGGKIIMPPSALHTLTRLNTVYPMLFKLTNREKSRHTHSGVLEFIAEEGKVYLPYWMMRNLLLDEGSMLHVQSVSLPVATFSKFQPHSVDFLDIHNPKAVLENALRNFACLTTGDVIAINYNDKVYELSVLETKPGDAVSIIECDMNVEFEAPIGYQEPGKKGQHQGQNKTAAGSGAGIANLAASDVADSDDVTMVDASEANLLPKVKVFTGHGSRLDGKPPKESVMAKSATKEVVVRGVPDYNYRIGTLKFWRLARKPKPESSGEQSQSSKTGSGTADDPDEQMFTGKGQTLFKPKKT